MSPLSSARSTTPLSCGQKTRKCDLSVCAVFAFTTVVTGLGPTMMKFELELAGPPRTHPPAPKGSDVPRLPAPTGTRVPQERTAGPAGSTQLCSRPGAAGGDRNPRDAAASPVRVSDKAPDGAREKACSHRTSERFPPGAPDPFPGTQGATLPALGECHTPAMGSVSWVTTWQLSHGLRDRASQPS